MKTKLIQTENNQHVVAIDNGSELRAYLVNHSLHTVCATAETLNRDACRYGEDIGELSGFANLPLINVRIAKSGKKMYSIAQ